MSNMNVVDRIYSSYESLVDRVSQTVGATIDRCFDVIYRFSGTNLLVNALDRTEYFDSTQYDDGLNGDARDLKAEYLFGVSSTVYGIIAADSICTLTGTGLVVLDLIHHARLPKIYEKITELLEINYTE